MSPTPFSANEFRADSFAEVLRGREGETRSWITRAIHLDTSFRSKRSCHFSDQRSSVYFSCLYYSIDELWNFLPNWRPGKLFVQRGSIDQLWAMTYWWDPSFAGVRQKLISKGSERLGSEVLRTPESRKLLWRSVVDLHRVPNFDCHNLITVLLYYPYIGL